MSKNNLTAKQYLLEKEWSMGNGQCPDCCGHPADWHGHPCFMTPEGIGHEKDCTLASSLQSLGVKPLYIGEYKSDLEFEHFISEQGLFGVRLKTEGGCERHKKWLSNGLNS